MLRAAMPRTDGDRRRGVARVRQQYEENPYPRWVMAPAAPRREHRSISARAVSDRHLPPLGKTSARRPGRRLRHRAASDRRCAEFARRAAACGRSEPREPRAMPCARRPRGSQLAIDYAQADILKLGIARPDLRHDRRQRRAAPHGRSVARAGAACSLLRAGGLMHIGLYSESRARKIAAPRSFVAEALQRDAGRHPPLPPGYPRCKRRWPVAASSDFFSTSECRDLLFHVQEHRVTIPAYQGFPHREGLTSSASIRCRRAAAPSRHCSPNRPVDRRS